jgi:hypothetical protein
MALIPLRAVSACPALVTLSLEAKGTPRGTLEERYPDMIDCYMKHLGKVDVPTMEVISKWLR